MEFKAEPPNFQPDGKIIRHPKPSHWRVLILITLGTPRGSAEKRQKMNLNTIVMPHRVSTIAWVLWMGNYTLPSHILWERIGWRTQPEEEIQTANRWFPNPLYSYGLTAKFSSWILLSCQFRLLLVPLGFSQMILSFASMCHRKSEHWIQGLCVLFLVKWHDMNMEGFYTTCVTWTYLWWLGTIWWSQQLNTH